MKFILTDYARAKKRLCRGGDKKRIPFSVAVGELAHYDVATSREGQEAMHALEILRKQSPLAGDVAYHRFVLGLTVSITAEALHVSERTVKSKWTYAKAWLRDKLSDDNMA
jgi:DNA-directed RNA polymerase specialized sigma24 family protein